MDLSYLYTLPLLVLGAGAVGAVSVLLAKGRHTQTSPKIIFHDSPQTHLDEYLKETDGEFRPLNPPEFVPKGTNPVTAARARTRTEGVRYSTRRVDHMGSL